MAISMSNSHIKVIRRNIGCRQQTQAYLIVYIRGGQTAALLTHVVFSVPSRSVGYVRKAAVRNV